MSMHYVYVQSMQIFCDFLKKQQQQSKTNKKQINEQKKQTNKQTKKLKKTRITVFAEFCKDPSG